MTKFLGTVALVIVAVVLVFTLMSLMPSESVVTVDIDTQVPEVPQSGFDTYCEKAHLPLTEDGHCDLLAALQGK